MRRTITPQRAKELFSYDPETGNLTRRIKAGNRTKVGDIVGCKNKAGHLAVTADYERCLVHDLIWLMMTEQWPNPEIDHRDMDGSNNRWANLREATKSQNGANRRMQPNNKIGLKGVSWHSTMKQYRARIMIEKKEMLLGYFDCPAAAHFAYIVGSDIYFGEFARAR